VSVYSDVDAAPDPARLDAFLDHAARAEWGMKHHAAAVLALAAGGRPVLDLGCGGGHDLALLASVGVAPVGVDPSRHMTERSRARVGAVPLVQAVGERLPFPDGAFGGCRVERVLMHVVEPAVVVAEAVRCLGAGAPLVVFEPDWSGLVVRGPRGDESAGWIAGARHPGVGGQLWRLIEDAGCEVTDRVEELSVWRSLEVLDRITGGIDGAVRAAAAAGRVCRGEAEAWLVEQHAREGRGAFLALMPKVMVVARVGASADA